MEQIKDNQHESKREQKSAERQRSARKRSFNRSAKRALIILFVAVGIWGLWYWGSSNSSPQTTRALAFSCTTDTLTTFHIHPHLVITINGQDQQIPAGIGNSITCLHPIHTHDTSGMIHVESPSPRDFTLADFFAVWGKTFNHNQILNSVADASHTITMTVNGVPSQDFEDLVLRDKDQIVIAYGPTKP